VRDRCTKAHEYLFLLSKGPRYYFDADAIAEDCSTAGRIPGGNRNVDPSRNDASRDMSVPVGERRNKRSVWDRGDAAVQGSALRHVPACADRALHPRWYALSRSATRCSIRSAALAPPGWSLTDFRRDAILMRAESGLCRDCAQAHLQGDSPLFAEVAG
jgi:hypothetical protein